MHWWRWRGVCAYRGSLGHNQLQWARCAARRVHGWRGRGRGPCGAELQRALARAPVCALSSSLTFPLAPAPLSPARPPPAGARSDSSLCVPPSPSGDCRMFTLRRERAPTTTLSQIQGSRAPGPPLIGYLLGDWQARNDWLRTRGPPSGRSDWLLFNLGSASSTPGRGGPPGSRPLATFSAPPLARHPFRHILTLRVRPSGRRTLRGSGRSLQAWQERRDGERKGTEGAGPEGNKGGNPCSTATSPLHPGLRRVAALAPPATPQTGEAPGAGAPFGLIPTDRGVPSGFRVSSFRRQPAPVSVSARVGTGSSQRPELGSRPGFLEIRHRNFPQWLRAGGGPLCLRSRMPSSGEPPAGDPRSARACGTGRSPPPWRSPPLLAPPAALPPPSPGQAGSRRDLAILEGAGRRSRAKCLRSSRAGLSP